MDFIVYVLTYNTSFWFLPGFSFNTYVLFAWVGGTPVLGTTFGQHVTKGTLLLILAGTTAGTWNIDL